MAEAEGRPRRGALPDDWIPEQVEAFHVRPSVREFPISWSSGCAEHDVIYVDERPEQVVVDVWLEPARLEDDEDCLAMGYHAVGWVRLAAPLGERTLRTHVVTRAQGTSGAPSGAGGR